MSAFAAASWPQKTPPGGKKKILACKYLNFSIPLFHFWWPILHFKRKREKKGRRRGGRSCHPILFFHPRWLSLQNPPLSLSLLSIPFCSTHSSAYSRACPPEPDIRWVFWLKFGQIYGKTQAYMSFLSVQKLSKKNHEDYFFKKKMMSCMP